MVPIKSKNREGCTLLSVAETQEALLLSQTSSFLGLGSSTDNTSTGSSSGTRTQYSWVDLGKGWCMQGLESLLEISDFIVQISKGFFKNPFDI